MYSRRRSRRGPAAALASSRSSRHVAAGLHRQVQVGELGGLAPPGVDHDDLRPSCVARRLRMRLNSTGWFAVMFAPIRKNVSARSMSS